MTTPAIRRLTLTRPEPVTFEIHHCDPACEICGHYWPDPDAPLTAAALARLGVLGFGLGVTIAAMLDPAGVARSVLAAVGIGL
jgi:hypothetical protein